MMGAICEGCTSNLRRGSGRRLEEGRSTKTWLGQLAGPAVPGLAIEIALLGVLEHVLGRQEASHASHRHTRRISARHSTGMMAVGCTHAKRMERGRGGREKMKKATTEGERGRGGGIREREREEEKSQVQTRPSGQHSTATTQESNRERVRERERIATLLALALAFLHGVFLRRCRGTALVRLPPPPAATTTTTTLLFLLLELLPRTMQPIMSLQCLPFVLLLLRLLLRFLVLLSQLQLLLAPRQELGHGGVPHLTHRLGDGARVGEDAAIVGPQGQ